MQYVLDTKILQYIGKPIILHSPIQNMTDRENKVPRTISALKYYSIGNIGYRFCVCHGLFRLYWMMQTVTRRKRELQNENFLSKVILEPTTFHLLDWRFNQLCYGTVKNVDTYR